MTSLSSATPSPRWERVEALFHEALSLGAEERDDFLRRSCGSDALLRQDVESLLVADADAGSFPERHALDGRAAVVAADGYALVPGTCIGRYEIQALVGSGGLGAVYRAHDARLNRVVAIKVLHPHLAYPRSSQVRIEREARTLAGLSHPHICPVFDVGREDGVSYLVMQYLVGDTLADKVALGPLPLLEGLQYAIDIADALDYAHRCGIVHRDVKPGNVMLTSEGAKLLDFGLAKLVGASADRTSPAPDTTATTGGGVASTAESRSAALGTPQYMAPEQIIGGPVDARADLFTFGAVVYEMFTGTRAFGGSTPAELAAAIVSTQPSRVSSSQPSVPAALDRLVERCLAQKPEDRWATAGDVREELIAIRATVCGVPSVAAPNAQAKRTPQSWRRIAAYLIGAAGCGAVLLWLTMQPEALFKVEWNLVGLPSDAPYVAVPVKIELSANGSQLLYPAPNGLSIRSRDRLAVRRVDGRRSLSSTFLSPDGSRIAHITNGTLSVGGTAGSHETIASGFGPYATGSWSLDNTILIADERALWRVSPERGARPERLNVPSPGAGWRFVYPVLLPDGRHVLTTVAPANTFPIYAVQGSDARVEVIDVETGARRTIVEGAGMASYVSTGHLVYLAGGELYAVPFDARRMMVGRDRVAIARTSNYAVASDDTLIYTADADAANRTLVWVDRQGNEEPLNLPPMPYAYPRLSPDETQIAVDVGKPDRDILLWDRERPTTLRRFSVDDSTNTLLAWTRDGERIAFGSSRSGVPNLFIQGVRSETAERLRHSLLLQMPLSFAPDGRLLFSEDVPGNDRDISAFAMDGTGQVTPLIATAADDGEADVSPDARWLAYDSRESGQFEVYVVPYPATQSAAPYQVSVGGGRQPLWSRSGDELYYRDFTGALFAVKTPRTSTFTASAPVRLLEGGPYAGAGSELSGRMYDIGKDGRFLMVKNSADGALPMLVQVRHWFKQLPRNRVSWRDP